MKIKSNQMKWIQIIYFDGCIWEIEREPLKFRLSRVSFPGSQGEHKHIRSQRKGILGGNKHFNIRVWGRYGG